jgi:hypothetical protein
MNSFLMFLNAYLICLRLYTRKHHKRTVQSGGAASDGKIYFPLMTKGERFIRCREQRHGSRGRRFIRCRGQRKIYQIRRTEAWFQGEHE